MKDHDDLLDDIEEEESLEESENRLFYDRNRRAWTREINQRIYNEKEQFKFVSNKLKEDEDAWLHKIISDDEVIKHHQIMVDVDAFISLRNTDRTKYPQRVVNEVLNAYLKTLIANLATFKLVEIPYLGFMRIMPKKHLAKQESQAFYLRLYRWKTYASRVIKPFFMKFFIRRGDRCILKKEWRERITYNYIP